MSISADPPKTGAPQRQGARPTALSGVPLRLGRPAGRWAMGATIAVLALVGTLVTTDPGGWLHHRRSVLPLHTGAGTAVTVGLVPRPRVRAAGEAAQGSLRTLPPLPRPVGVLPAVPGLSTTRSVDAIVTLPSAVTSAEVTALAHIRGLSALEEVDTGTVSLAGAPAVTLGVDPGTFRQFTPKVTASDDNLWRYLAGGALASSYEMAADRSLALGKDLTIKPAGDALAPTTAWLGALASLGLPGVDLVVGHAYSDRLGLTLTSGLVVSASGMDPSVLSAALTSTLPGASVELVHPAQTCDRPTTRPCHPVSPATP